ncbi:MAG: homocysteine biosynthesis protein, partial [Odoribacter sp.]|nr:homocysteine biosynthesis protein [Odoribacter sp.]
MAKSYAEINEKIRKGTAVVLTAEEVAELSRSISPKEIAEKVDVVTTGTFGAMCSSGAFINFGHAEPPIRMEKIELNGVRVSGGLAAVDTYIGATDCNPDRPAYGGAHII